MVDRLKSEICLTSIPQSGLIILHSTGTRHRQLKQRFRWQSNAMSLVTLVLKRAEANSHHSASHFAIIYIKKVTTKFNELHNICKRALKEIN